MHVPSSSTGYHLAMPQGVYSSLGCKINTCRS
jgi:hypothetical protein